MNSTLQTVIALALVTFCATWLVVRLWRKKNATGCGGDCACPAKIVVKKSQEQESRGR